MDRRWLQGTSKKGAAKQKEAESLLRFCWYSCLDARCLRVCSAQAYSTSRMALTRQGIVRVYTHKPHKYQALPKCHPKLTPERRRCSNI